MKKLISIFSAIALLSLFIFPTNIYAVKLDSVEVTTDKTIVRPSEEVNLTINFGQSMGAYTANVAYDNNIFEYVSVDGGTANDTTDKVIVTFYDTTGGSSPRENMSITFRAKSGITTSNPTELTVTLEGLSNSDASVTYEDITTPIVKNITVEPEYQDYVLNLEHSGEIVKEEEIPMTLSYSSTMGRYYEHARLIAESTTPTNATVKLLATDESDLEHDIIQSGWGDAQGFEIGGANVAQVLQTRAVFSDAGDYTITLKLIDRDNSDQIISSETFSFTVLDEATTVTPSDETTEEEITTQEEETTISEETTEDITETTPETLPKTGSNIYAPIIVALSVCISLCVYYNSKKTK